MRKRMRQRISPAWAVAVGALVVAGGGAAVAAIPDGSGVIHGCYQKSSRHLSVIDPAQGEQCKAGEVALEWNKQGQSGVVGPIGPTGPQGPKGDTGATGADGAKGDPCHSSDLECRGPVGPRGEKGDTGDSGPIGAQGDSGPTGPVGPKGDPCLATDTACRGPKGDKGDTGADGPIGPAGPAGPSGSGIVSTSSLNGPIPNLTASAPGAWAFVGPTVQLTLASSQRVTASLVGMFAHTGGSSATLNYAICVVAGDSSVQPATNGGAVQSLGIYVSSSLSAYAPRGSYAVSGSRSVAGLGGAGTYRAGLCTNQNDYINNNDRLSGWIMVTS